ncbi:MAG: hypothetical protein IJV14_02720 [Lachnospiraceae bacterium]|nr:hypothetical protein [Lachnospiraceae bacterium]
MNRKITAMLIGTLVLSVLSGCSGAPAAEEAEEKSFLSETAGTIYENIEEAAAAEEELPAEAAESTVGENIGETQDTEGEQALSDTGISSDEPTLFGEAFLDGEVENNGGYFVRIGDRVYFRMYGPESLDPITVGTNVLSYGTPAGGSRIQYYDIKTKEVVDAFADDGFGRLYAAANGFWFCRNDAREDAAPDTVLYWVAEDGSESEDFGYGTPLGVSEDGAYVAFLPYDDNYGSIEILSGGEMLSMVSPEYNEDLTYIGMAEDQLIFLSRTKEDYVTSRHVLYSMDIVTSELTELGKIPYEENSPIQDAYLIPEQYETEGREVYVLAAQYEGSEHFLQDYIAVKATAGKEDSIELISYEEAVNDNLPGLVVTDGDAELLPAQPHTAGLSDGYFGSLDYYDSAFSAIQLVPDYVPDFNEDSLFRTALQTVEVVGDDVFVIRSIHERSPENDIGWRYAYRLHQMNYERFSWKILDENMNTGDLSALGSVLIPEEGVTYSTPDGGDEINVYILEDPDQEDPGYEYFDYAEGDPYAMEIAFEPRETVHEFWLYQMTWNEKEEYEEIYHKRELTPDSPLIASVTFPGDMSAYAFSYYLEDGTERMFRITLSGKDGSLVVNEIE